MRFILCSLLFWLAGCSVLTPMDKPQPVGNEKVDVALYYATTNSINYDVGVFFYEWTDYEILVQEVYIGSTVVVECFDMPHGQLPPFVFDRHWSEAPGDYEFRWMRLYPARVEGHDKNELGFAMLPSNMDGSIETNAGSNFNAKYRWKTGPDGKASPEYGVNHRIQGRIVAADESVAVIWTLEYKDGELTVNLPRGHVINRTPKSLTGGGDDGLPGRNPSDTVDPLAFRPAGDGLVPRGLESDD